MIPLSLSAFKSSKTHANLKESFPICFASYSYLSKVLASIPPYLKIKWPVEVDFPESTCPITTMDNYPFVFFDFSICEFIVRFVTFKFI